MEGWNTHSEIMGKALPPLCVIYYQFVEKDCPLPHGGMGVIRNEQRAWSIEHGVITQTQGKRERREERERRARRPAFAGGYGVASG